ncbi:uncharacterized protein LOC105750207 [Sarcophilus harrisii]|uniref:uncharacterized protein LOC105750207 n=1 Tax=Sarcophilus harrisii TaxID=9305 RepID=UPI001301A4A6|nr:uncharacterized protein LOC105750207 [Sarcophilus harrisii]
MFNPLLHLAALLVPSLSSFLESFFFLSTISSTLEVGLASFIFPEETRSQKFLKWLKASKKTPRKAEFLFLQTSLSLLTQGASDAIEIIAQGPRHYFGDLYKKTSNITHFTEYLSVRNEKLTESERVQLLEKRNTYWLPLVSQLEARLKLTPCESVERSKYILEMGEKEELLAPSKSRSQPKIKEAIRSIFLLAQDLATSCSNCIKSRACKYSSDEQLELSFSEPELKDSFVCSMFLLESQLAEDDKNEDGSNDDDGGELNYEVISDKDDEHYKDAADIQDNFKFQDKCADVTDGCNANHYNDGSQHDNTKEIVYGYDQDDKDIYYDGGSNCMDSHDDDNRNIDKETHISCNSLRNRIGDNGKDKNGNADSLFDKRNNDRINEKDNNSSYGDDDDDDDDDTTCWRVTFTILMLTIWLVMLVVMMIMMVPIVRNQLKI